MGSDEEDFFRIDPRKMRHLPRELAEEIAASANRRFEDEARRRRQIDGVGKAARSPCVRLNVRLPRQVHSQATIIVARSGISLNTFIVMAVSRAVGEEIATER